MYNTYNYPYFIIAKILCPQIFGSLPTFILFQKSKHSLEFIIHSYTFPPFPLFPPPSQTPQTPKHPLPPRRGPPPPGAFSISSLYYVAARFPKAPLAISGYRVNTGGGGGSGFRHLLAYLTFFSFFSQR